MILFNEGDSPGRMNALFRAGPTDMGIPAVLSSFAVGKELYDGANPTARLKTSGVNVDRVFPQVIADSKSGDPNHVVMAGAHLDSVTAGPGINDDGSGTAWQLELGEQIPKLGTKPRHKIRLMWFGGEEDGLVGSQYYAEHLPQDEVDKIDVMIDTDMIASPNYARLVYDGDHDETEAGSAGPPAPGSSSTCSSASGRSVAWPARTSRSTAGRTTSASSTAASRRAASSPGRRRPRRRSRSRSTAASRVSSSTRATTSRATTSTRSPASRRPAP